MSATTLGIGAVSVLRGVAGDALGFRSVFTLALIPLVLLAIFARHGRDTPRFRTTRLVERRRPGAVPRAHLPRNRWQPQQMILPQACPTRLSSSVTRAADESGATPAAIADHPGVRS